MPPKKKGRPPRDPSEPPCPRGLKPEERLAVCLAYCEASEQGQADAGVLETKASDLYAAQLANVDSKIAKFPVSRHRWAERKEWYAFTLEESQARRPGKVNMINTFKETRKVCNNEITDVYFKLHNTGGEPPSGTARGTLISKMVAELNKLTKPGEEDKEQDDEDGEEGAGEEGGAELGGGIGTGGAFGGARGAAEREAAPPPTTTPSPNGLEGKFKNYWLTWLHMGPLAEHPHREFTPPMPTGSNKPDPKKPGRDASKAKRLQEAADAASSSTLTRIEQDKLKAIHKVNKGEKKSRKMKREFIKIEKQKLNQASFDSQVERLEKRIKLTKDKTKISDLNTELEKLLEAGPAVASDPEQSEESADEKEGGGEEEEPEEQGEEGGEEEAEREENL